MKKIGQFILLASLTLLVFLPGVSFAQSTTLTMCAPQVNDFGDILCRIAYLLRAIIPILLGLGVVYFVWGVVQYVINGDDEARKKGQARMVYGIIGLAIIVGLWGIVALVVNTFGLSQNITIVDPTSVFVQNSAQNNSGAGSSCNLPNGAKFQDVIKYGTCLIGAVVIPFIFALATVMFLWGAVQFLIMGAGDEEKRTRGKQLMIWGIIALSVMIGVWGLVQIVGNTFNIDTHFLPQVKPQ
jgi:hypothetical protein